MPDILGPYRETAASPRIWEEPKPIKGRITVDSELAIPVLQTRPNGQILGERINDLSPLGPERHLREVLMVGAKLFVQQLARRRERYRLHTPESELRIWGPVQFLDLHATGAVPFALDEWLHPEALDFKIVGDFVAEYGFLVEPVTDEELKTLALATVATWRDAENAGRKRLGLPGRN